MFTGNLTLETLLKVKYLSVLSPQINLQTLEKATEEDLRRAKTEAEKQTQSDAKASDAKKHKLNTELKLLVNTLASTTNENREEEQGLRKVTQPYSLINKDCYLTC